MKESLYQLSYAGMKCETVWFRGGRGSWTRTSDARVRAVCLTTWRFLDMVPGAGFEPARLSAAAFEAAVSASSATRA